MPKRCLGILTAALPPYGPRRLQADGSEQGNLTACGTAPFLPKKRLIHGRGNPRAEAEKSQQFYGNLAKLQKTSEPSDINPELRG